LTAEHPGVFDQSWMQIEYPMSRPCRGGRGSPSCSIVQGQAGVELMSTWSWWWWRGPNRVASARCCFATGPLPHAPYSLHHHLCASLTCTRQSHCTQSLLTIPKGLEFGVSDYTTYRDQNATKTWRHFLLPRLLARPNMLEVCAYQLLKPLLYICLTLVRRRNRCSHSRPW
jgi:hypothetical protein